MAAGDPYLELNRANWDERAPAHASSPDYAVDRFLSDPAFISDVVAFDRPRLGDLAGCSAVHLQCHIGTDTLSLQRLGAAMVGVDFSPASLTHARDLAARAGAPIEYVRSDVYDAPQALGGRRFDLVYTGIGALCWLPSIERWAQVVTELLAPGGRLFIREGHPMLWALDSEPAPDCEAVLDPRTDGSSPPPARKPAAAQERRLAVRYPYFETVEPIVDDDPGTYVETDVSFAHNLTHSWNHGLGEIVGALLARGMRLTMLEEHDSVPWDAFPGLMERIDGGEWRLREHPERVAHSYTLQAVRGA